MYTLSLKKTLILNASILLLSIATIATDQALSQNRQYDKAGIVGASFTVVSVALALLSLYYAIKLAKITLQSEKPGAIYATAVTSISHVFNMSAGLIGFLLYLLAALNQQGQSRASNLLFAGAIINLFQTFIAIGSGLSVSWLNSIFSENFSGDEGSDLLSAEGTPSRLAAIEAEKQPLFACPGNG